MSDRFRGSIRSLLGRHRGGSHQGRWRRTHFSLSPLERLDARVLLSTMTVSGVTFDDTSHTFTSDGASHTLTLYEVQPGDGTTDLGFTVDGSELAIPGITGTDSVITDTGTSEVPITSSSPPTIIVNLGNGGNTLSLDGSWTFTDPVTFTGGTGGDTLDDSNSISPNTWQLSAGGDGEINSGSRALLFTSVSQINGGPTDTLTGDSNASTWTVNSSGTNTYSDGTATTTFTGFENLVGSQNNTFDINGDAPGDDTDLGVINDNLTGVVVPTRSRSRIRRSSMAPSTDRLASVAST